MSAKEIRTTVLSYLDAMLADPKCEVVLSRNASLAPDMKHDEVHDRYVLGKLLVVIKTPTFKLTVEEV